MRDVQAAPGGAGVLNSLIKGAIAGGWALSALDVAEVEAAGCGELEALELVPRRRMQDVLITAASPGVKFRDVPCRLWRQAFASAARAAAARTGIGLMNPGSAIVGAPRP